MILVVKVMALCQEQERRTLLYYRAVYRFEMLLVVGIHLDQGDIGYRAEPLHSMPLSL
jgi:hypothetical protein